MSRPACDVGFPAGGQTFSHPAWRGRRRQRPTLHVCCVTGNDGGRKYVYWKNSLVGQKIVMSTNAGNRMRFATTQWSLVLVAGERGSPDSGQALAQLCSLYWYPVFAFVRRQLYSPDEAQDLTQSFFTRLIDKNDIGDAVRSRGRFRTFLLTACRHFLLNEWDRVRRLKRGGDQVHVPIDVHLAEERYERAITDSETPERIYDRQWCFTLLDRALDSLRRNYAASGKEHIFHRLRDVLTFDEKSGTYADAARDLNMTPAAVKVAAYRLRGRYREMLRRCVADTVASEAEVDEEIRYLLKTLNSKNLLSP
ncbi:MAG: sigma-70 family RNA polymerase sigma factor [bacterium]|nr:sigma-70 family RNA polymerase sigma factor [bacterium]